MEICATRHPLDFHLIKRSRKGQARRDLILHNVSNSKGWQILLSRCRQKGLTGSDYPALVLIIRTHDPTVFDCAKIKFKCFRKVFFIDFFEMLTPPLVTSLRRRKTKFEQWPLAKVYVPPSLSKSIYGGQVELIQKRPKTISTPIMWLTILFTYIPSLLLAQNRTRIVVEFFTKTCTRWVIGTFWCKHTSTLWRQVAHFGNQNFLLASSIHFSIFQILSRLLSRQSDFFRS